MPRSDSIVNIPGYRVKKIISGDPIVIEVELKKAPFCPDCGSKNLRNKGRVHRLLHHETIGIRRSQLCVKVGKYCCLSCGRYFREHLPGILPYKRATEPLRKEVFLYHNKGISQSDLSRMLALGKSTIERWYHDIYKRENSKLESRSAPRILGIDEHHFSKKEGYVTTLCDLRKHRVFDVVKGRSNATLKDYLLSLKGRENVRVVCMDLSSSYRSIVRKYFPNAKIVADRFHVIKLINESFIKTCREIDGTIKYHRGILAILRKNPENLTPKQRERRDKYFKENPSILEIYKFKQSLHHLMMNKRCTAKKCRQLIPKLFNFIDMMASSGLKHFISLARTIKNWQEEIARMWRFTKSNGITEGFHRKMKLIQRRAYGFRNFENYRLRVRVLCA